MSRADTAADRQFAPRESLLRRADQRVLHHHRGGAGVVEDERDLLGVEHEVDRHEHHAELRGGERQHHVLPGVVRQQREPVTLGQPAPGQRVCGPVGGGVELGVGEAVLAVDHGELVRVAGGGAAQQIPDPVLAGPGDGGGGVGGETHVGHGQILP